MAGLAERRADDERDVGDAVVDEESVGAFSMFAQALAVIAHDDDDRAVVELMGLQRGDETRKLTVGEGDFPVVGMSLVSRRKGFGRSIGSVWIVQMDPREEWRS